VPGLEEQLSTLLIEGGQRLSGQIHVEGNKNSALPLLAACLLTEDECVLHNVPRIGDVEVMARLLLDLGAEVDGIGTTTLRIRCPQVLKDEPDPTLVGRLRGSVLLLGPLLARRGRVRLAAPGGDFPVRRTIDTHLAALKGMGAHIIDAPGHALDAPDGLTGVSIYLDEASVTGTETALLAAACARGRSEIRHAATEPHVAELCRFLQAMGVGIAGGGTSTIQVEGVARRTGATHTLWGDYIDAGSWAVIGAITGGTVEVTGARAEDVEVCAAVLRRLGVNVSPLDQAYSLEALRLVPYFGLIVYFGIDVLNFALAMLGTLLLIRVIVRDQRVSVIIWVLSVATLNLGVGAMPWDLVFAVALAAFAVFVLLRFGLFSTAVMLFFTDLMTRLPITLSARAWYFPLSMLTMVLIGGLAVYGFVVALAGRSPFGAVVSAADREA